jgi:hypothetical protein
MLVGYNFDEFYRQFLKLFKQILNDPNSDHPLKHLFTNDDIDRLMENPPTQEDIYKIMQYFSENLNFNPFMAGNPYFTRPPAPPAKPPAKEKNAQKPKPDSDIVIDTFELQNEVHILVCTSRTDLEFKTGVKKDNPREMALVIQNKQGSIVQVAKLSAKIDKKSKRVTYNNGIYEIIYRKNA